MRLWRKLFPVRERTIFVQDGGPVVSHAFQWQGSAIFVTRHGDVWVATDSNVAGLVFSKMTTLRDN